MTKYEVSKKSIDGLGRNEWTCIANMTSKAKAIKFAKMASKRHKYETDVRGFDSDGDVCFHAYYNSGKLTIDMSV